MNREIMGLSKIENGLPVMEYHINMARSLLISIYYKKMKMIPDKLLIMKEYNTMNIQFLELFYDEVRVWNVDTNVMNELEKHLHIMGVLDNVRQDK